MEEIKNTVHGLLNRISRDEARLAIRCEVCGEPMYQAFDIDVHGVTQHMITPRQCECKRIEYEALKEKERKANIEIARERSLPNAVARACRFDTSDDSDQMQLMRRYADKWESVKYEAGLMLWGGVGTGKTHAAYCIANALIDKQVSVYVTRISALADSVFDDQYGQRFAMDRVKNCALLVLDDVGTERDTSFMCEKAFEFVDARVESGKPMIVTTNLSPQMMDQTTDLNRKRLFDRIRGATAPIEFKGGSRRAAKARDNVSKLRDILKEA